MEIDFELAISRYLDYLRIERALSSNSIAAYSRDLQRFKLYCEERNLNFSQLSEDEFSQMVGELNADGLSLASVNRFLSSLKGFYKYCTQEFELNNDNFEVKHFKLTRKLPKALTVEEISLLIDGSSRISNPQSLRDRLIVELLYGTGARVSELVGIDISDISHDVLEGEKITILKLRGKGSKERLVPLGRYAVEALDNYLVRLRPLLQERANRGERALFLNSRGGRLTRQSAWSTVLKIAEEVGLAGRVSPHVFRHSYATHLLDGGADIRVVQELLGHASVTTTQIYTLVTIDKVRESYSLAHPRAHVQ